MNMFITTLAQILPTPPTGTPAIVAKEALDFFSTWIARAGGMIAFVGAIKFALSIKSEDSKEQLQSIFVMISGFMIVSAIRNLGVFNFPGTYSTANADAEFASILSFVGKWIRRVGALGMLIGSTMFGFAIKDNNATTKVNSLKTIASGGLIIAISLMLYTFAYI